MLCDNCESELRKNWKFCPVCGAEIIQEDILISLGNILRSITRKMEFFEERPSGYKVDVMDKRIDNTETETHSGKRTAHKNGSKLTIEPKTLIKNFGNRIVFAIKLPSVDPDDLKLTELDESFEVKAWSKDKAYFKIITVPQGFSLEDQYFENGKLVLEFVA